MAATPRELPWSGDTTCEREDCGKRAYYAVGRSVYCGVHSKKEGRERRPLPKDPDGRAKRQRKLDEHMASLHLVTLNGGTTRRGRVVCYRMLMLRVVPLQPPWMNIMPNNRAADRTDGVGMPSLSPMRLGPVQHRQPGLPPSRNIENYHQANKVWPCELAREVTTPPPPPRVTSIHDMPEPSAEWAIRQREMYEDEEPHRHKFPLDRRKKKKKPDSGALPSVNQNAPCYSIHFTLDGESRRFTYVQSRYFYCCAYERLAPATEDFKRLLNYLEQGVDLRLCGYDAFDMGISSDADTIYAHYCNEAQSFGHERALYALLVLAREELPWHRYRREHPDVYANIAHVDVGA